MKKITVSWMSKKGSMPEAIYCEGKDGWYPVVYFRKSKFATQEEYEIIKQELKKIFNL